MSRQHVFLFLMATTAGGAVIAQTSNDSTFKPLEQVVVTATKYPVKEGLTGKVLTVITKEQLEKSGGKQLTEI
jgi:vitamin B12 transporter